MSDTTAGPWVLLSDNGQDIAIMPAGRPGNVAKFIRGSVTREDASLMAAAPDMLKTLIAIRDTHAMGQAEHWKVARHGPTLREMLDDAIARASPAKDED